MRKFCVNFSTVPLTILPNSQYFYPGDLDLRRSLDCEFISDTIRAPFRYEACRMLTSAVLTGYPLEQWIDMVKYFSFGNAALISSIDKK